MRSRLPIAFMLVFLGWNINVIAQSPTGVSLTAPLASATRVPVTVTFSWTGGTRATTFEVKLATVNYPTNIVATVPGTQRTWTSPPLAPATKYYWRITARNARGTKTSATRSFTTAVAPAPPPPPMEVCGDKIDNDKDGQVDEDCAPPSSPDLTQVPPAISLLDCKGATWTMGGPVASEPGNSYIIRNGASTGGWAAFIRLSGCTVYAFNPLIEGGYCYEWRDNDSGGDWSAYGAGVCPGEPTVPPLPPSSAIPRVMFTAPPEHDTSVQHYRLEVEGPSEVTTINRMWIDKNLGKPALINGEVNIEVPEFNNLLGGRVYSVWVSAYGNGTDVNGNPIVGYGERSDVFYYAHRVAPAMRARSPRLNAIVPLNAPMLPGAKRPAAALPAPEAPRTSALRPLGDRRLAVEFHQSGKRVLLENISFECGEQSTPPELVVSPTVNPTQISYTFNRTGCRADISNLVEKLPTGELSARIRRSAEDWDVSNSFRVERSTARAPLTVTPSQTKAPITLRPQFDSYARRLTVQFLRVDTRDSMSGTLMFNCTNVAAQDAVTVDRPLNPTQLVYVNGKETCRADFSQTAALLAQGQYRATIEGEQSVGVFAVQREK